MPVSSLFALTPSSVLATYGLAPVGGILLILLAIGVSQWYAGRQR